MKQATKTTRKSTATKQVKRVVATLALATAAGTAAAPAFASASCDNDRGDDGVGQAFGSDRPGARFGGAGRGVEVKDDGTVEVHTRGSSKGVGGLLSGVLGGAASAADDAVDGVSHAVDEATDPVEDVVDDVTGPVSGVGDHLPSPKPSASGAPGPSAEAGAGGKQTLASAATGTDDTDSTSKDSGKKDSGKKDSGKKETGKKASGKAAEPEQGEPGYFAMADIDYSGTRDRELAAESLPGVPQESDEDGEVLAFKATARVLGFEPETFSSDPDEDRSGAYEPRHMRGASRSGERAPWETYKGAEEGTGGSSSFMNLFGGIGVGAVELDASLSGDGLELRAETDGTKAGVQLDEGGLSADAEVKDVAGVAAGASDQGVDASGGVAGAASLEAQAAATGDAAVVGSEDMSSSEAGMSGVEQELTGLAEREAQPFHNGTNDFVGQRMRGALSPAGAQFLSYEPTTVDRVAEEADAATREATIDAPLRVATTGTEAAALTGLAGALVVGGAGALLVANRGGRNGGPAHAAARNTTA
ncbi:hypothetical protein [Myceligenerans indicum]|uniref:Uncharacterized protein n=1 Tax=Myceligenerans indicum TaxID=2593663 RepID=A0ABS1LLZ9_9MICO|nr:hypothetical protein [Myceligenerans indicum]MBL0887305.1 hypothetical protein [Myceligenerans indicum]